MKFGFYTGCTSQADTYENELSSRTILTHFNIDYKDINDQTCCGTPIKSTKHELWAFLSARIHALAQAQGFEAIATICNGCDLSLAELEHELKNHPDLKEKINEALAKEGLHYDNSLPVYNILSIIYDEIGLERLQKSVKRKLKGLRTAAHYGCHAIRPTTISRPDDSENPMKIQEILETLGAKSPNYPELLDCCAATIIGVKAEQALGVSGNKVDVIKQRGYNSICNICPFCQKQLGNAQDVAGKVINKDIKLPSMYLSQYVGLAIGLDEESLGLQLNLTGWEELLSK
ncbi:MAG TPA: CoB--CoM heterodisulfide reductase iron-sulfur subunit B family protein [Candidatus Bathyarchaeia archaeon]|nr:CoB--CoM heterodisulfide reductase iron-sulfur subunit B family protein [Candidatus Bathyarchaeia archaeon]